MKFNIQYEQLPPVYDAVDAINLPKDWHLFLGYVRFRDRPSAPKKSAPKKRVLLLKIGDNIYQVGSGHIWNAVDSNIDIVGYEPVEACLTVNAKEPV